MNLYAMCLATGGLSGWFAEFARTFEKCFIREDRYKLLLEGIGVTIKISLLAALLGLVIGFLIAICSFHLKRQLKCISCGSKALRLLKALKQTVVEKACFISFLPRAFIKLSVIL